MSRVSRTLALALSVAVLILLAPLTAQAGNAPGDGCIPGTVWEDPASGVTYLCIYDEIYGGTRWDVLPSSSQRGAAAWLYRSSTHGCLLGQSGLTGLGGSGATAMMRTYRWPCQTIAHRATHPAGELRTRAVIQVYDGGWRTCRDSGYSYNTASSWGWMASLGMGSLADCGSGSYRAWGFGGFLQGGAWRTGSLTTLSMYLR